MRREEEKTLHSEGKKDSRGKRGAAPQKDERRTNGENSCSNRLGSVKLKLALDRGIEDGVRVAGATAAVGRHKGSGDDQAAPGKREKADG